MSIPNALRAGISAMSDEITESQALINQFTDQLKAIGDKIVVQRARRVRERAPRGFVGGGARARDGGRSKPSEADTDVYANAKCFAPY